MKFNKIDSLPKKTHTNHKHRDDELMEFLAMNTRYAKVDYGDEFSSANSAQADLRLHVKSYDLFAKEDEA